MKNGLILLQFRHAYNKCKQCYEMSEKHSMKNDFHQRMDELLLLYSALYEISVNEARDVLDEGSAP